MVDVFINLPRSIVIGTSESRMSHERFEIFTDLSGGSLDYPRPSCIED